MGNNRQVNMTQIVGSHLSGAEVKMEQTKYLNREDKVSKKQKISGNIQSSEGSLPPL